MTNDNVVRIDDYQSHRSETPKPEPLLSGGGGGGTSGGMEARIASLEAHMGHVATDTGALKVDTSKLKTDVATLVERVAHLPGKGFVVTVVVSIGAVLAVLTTFAPAVQKLIGLTH